MVKKKEPPMSKEEKKRIQGRERARRFRERHPTRNAERKAVEDECYRWLIQLHPEEFYGYVKANRAAGLGRHKGRDRALSMLAHAHPDEWKQIRENVR